jgi:hypothetical protein
VTESPFRQGTRPAYVGRIQRRRQIISRRAGALTAGRNQSDTAGEPAPLRLVPYLPLSSRPPATPVRASPCRYATTPSVVRSSSVHCCSVRALRSCSLFIFASDDALPFDLPQSRSACPFPSPPLPSLPATRAAAVLRDGTGANPAVVHRPGAASSLSSLHSPSPPRKKIHSLASFPYRDKSCRLAGLLPPLQCPSSLLSLSTSHVPPLSSRL